MDWGEFFLRRENCSLSLDAQQLLHKDASKSLSTGTIMSRYAISGSQGALQPGSEQGVLANKLGITRPEDMNEAELVLLQKLYVEVLREHLPPGRISALHLRRWHRRWLGNVYDWAGQHEQRWLSLRAGRPAAAAHADLRYGITGPIHAVHGYGPRDLGGRHCHPACGVHPHAPVSRREGK